MKPALARGVAYGVVAALGILALRFTPQLPEHKPADVLVAQAGAARANLPWLLHLDTLGRGETLSKLFHRGGVSDSVTYQVLRAASVLDTRHVPAGMQVEFRHARLDSALTEIVFHLSVDRLLHLRHTGAGWVAAEEHLPWVTDTIVVAGTIHSNLYDAMDSSASGVLTSAARQQLTWNLADIFEYKVDMSRDLQDGDAFRVMAERSLGPDGAEKVGKILAATFTLSGSTLEAVRFASTSVAGDYFDQNGKSLRAAFLRAPLEFRRISSVFGMREHPILGVVREHKGIDYAAAAGTPIRAIGDGVIIRRGWGNGFGNVIEIRHRNGFVTRYGHMRAFASGLHVGSHVSISQTIGYVGSTGLATGPHLHFEVLVNGVQRNPRLALKSTGGGPLPSREMAAFRAMANMRVAALETPTRAPVALASR